MNRTNRTEGSILRRVRELFFVAVAVCLPSSALAGSVAGLAALIATSSCIGQKVDDVALFKPAAVAWESIGQQYEHGISNAEAEGEITATEAESLRAAGVELGRALVEGDRTGIALTPWATMRQWADRGIAVRLADGEIGPGVAASFTERVDNFTTTLERLRTTF